MQRRQMHLRQRLGRTVLRREKCPHITALDCLARLPACPLCVLELRQGVSVFEGEEPYVCLQMFAKFKLPLISGYIFAGVLAGRFVLNIIPQDNARQIDFLGNRPQ